MSKNFRSIFCAGVLLAVLHTGCTASAEIMAQSGAGAPTASPSPQATPLASVTAMPEIHGRLQLIEFFAIT